MSMGSGKLLGDRSHTSTRDACDLLNSVSSEVPQHHDFFFSGRKLHDGRQKDLLIFFETPVTALDGLGEALVQR